MKALPDTDFDWLRFAVDGRPLSPDEAGGYNEPPFDDDLVDLFSEEANGARRALKNAEVVACCAASRAKLYRSWHLALGFALWPAIPFEDVDKAALWASSQPRPAMAAAALAVVFREKYNRKAVLRNNTRDTWIRLLEQCMRELEDPQDAVSDEARQH